MKYLYTIVQQNDKSNFMLELNLDKECKTCLNFIPCYGNL